MNSICKNFVLVWLGGSLSLYAAATTPPDDFKDIQITLSTKMKGWSGKRPDGSSITYDVNGVSYMTADGTSSSRTWNISEPVMLAEARLDLFKMVEYEVYLSKKGEHAEVIKLLDPGTDPKTVAELNRPDVIKGSEEQYKDKTIGGILFAFQQDTAGDILVCYYLQGPSGKILQMDSVKKLNGSYVLVAEALSPPPDGLQTINIFTALFDLFHGSPGEIQVLPKS